MVYTLSKIITFEASHQLMNHDGKCARLHGHSWRAAIVCSGNQLIDSGAKQNMLIDYGDIKRAVKSIVEDYLDHHHLNETLKTDAPTSEFLARWLYQKIKPQLPLLTEIKVWETCTSECTYRE